MKLKLNTNRYFSSIQEFYFIKNIAVGPFGFVKMALHLQTNKCYDIKVIELSKIVCQDQFLLLQTEINIHTVIDHPHIVKVWDTLIQKETVYVVMELAEKGSLFNYQNKNPRLEQAEAFKYFIQSLSAAKYMHKNIIMHRDTKPQNILLDNSNNIKICDLGWATDNIKAKRRKFCGTYDYMSPEMIFDKDYDFTIDIWASGILLYYLLHGHAPFIAKIIDQMKETFQQGFFDMSPNISKKVKNKYWKLLKSSLKKGLNFLLLQHIHGYK